MRCATKQREFTVSNVKCLNPWDVQSREIMSADGVWYSLYAGEGGGRGYVIYPVCDTGKTVYTMNERLISMMITENTANTLVATDYKGCQLVCYENH